MNIKHEDAIRGTVVRLGFKEVGIGVLVLAFLQFIGGLWITARIQGSIKHEYDRKLEEVRYEIRVREHATRVAEYMVFARQLREDSPQSDYNRANTMAWELAMWLPSDVYKLLGEAIVQDNKQNNPLEVVVAVRRLLLGDRAGDLTSSNVLQHAPGIAAKMK